MRLWPLAFTIFFVVSGGPYGLEEVMKGGVGMGLLLILLMPLIWALPVALLTAELASAIPEQGGYYVWVKRAMGPFAGFLCGWWTWTYSWVDTAIYPVLFVGYMKSFIFSSFLSNPWASFWVSLLMIIPVTWMNIIGVRSVGKAATVFGILLLLPFLVMIIAGSGNVFTHGGEIFKHFIPSGQTPVSAFKAGLFVVMWNYLGWDSTSTIAGEVEKPQKNFPKAIAIGLPLVTLAYFLPALVGAAAVPDPAKWITGCWGNIAGIIGGKYLGYWIGLCGMISAAGLFMATLLSSSRIPLVIARNKALPEALTKLHPKYQTPYVAILISAFIYTALSILSFDQLAEIDVILYSSALLLEFVALIILRKKEPTLHRPFKIGGGWPMLIIICGIPTVLIIFAFFTFFSKNEGFISTLALIALATGPLIWGIHKLIEKRKRAVPNIGNGS